MSATHTAVHPRRKFASDEERRLAYNAYMREYNARKREAAATGAAIVPKREKLPISANRMADPAAYWREYQAMRADYIRERKHQYHLANKHHPLDDAADPHVAITTE